MRFDKTKLKKYTVSSALKLNTNEITALHLKHLNSISTWILRFVGTYRKFVKAEGIYLKDERGKTYLDFLSGYGALNLGHEPAEVLKALRSLEKRPNILQVSLNPFAGTLAAFLSEVAPGKLSRVFFCNSGAEAVESAIKLARCATGKTRLVSALNSFHGKTMGALSVSGREKYKKPFQPLVPDTKNIPFDDIAALSKELTRANVAAFIVEPIQGEGGVIVPRAGYLKEAERLCRKYGALLIVDEVQSGMGRTGKLFCCEHDGVEPDIICLSKSLSAGVVPIGAMMATERIWKKAYGSLDTCLLQTSTFGGNSRACACGITALHTLLDKGLIENAKVQGEALLVRLRQLKEKFPLIIKDVRGRGLMIGIHFHRLKGKGPLVEGAMTLWVVRRLFNNHNIITAFTMNNYDVLRIMPPLAVTRKQADAFADALEEVLNSVRIFAKLRLLNID